MDTEKLHRINHFLNKNLFRNIIETILKNLKAKNVKCDRIWLDVEGLQYWKTNKQQNVDFIQVK